MANTPVINVAGTDYNVIDHRCYFDGISTLDNLFNKFADGVLRDEIHSRSGELVSAPGYCESDYITVTPGTVYMQNNNRVYCTWYNSSKVYVGYSDYNDQNPNAGKTAPAGAAYGRFIFLLNEIDNAFVCQADKVIYQIPPVATTFFELSTTKNLFDKNADGVIVGGYISQWDVTLIQPSDVYGDSAPIQVTPGHRYTTPVRNVFVVWLKTDGTSAGVTSASDFTTNGYAQAPANAATGRFIFVMDTVDSFYVHDLSGTMIIPSRYLDDPKTADDDVNPWDGLGGVCFGTSLAYRSQTTGGFLNFLPALSGVSFDNQGIGSGVILGSSQEPNYDILAKVKAYTGYTGKRVCLLEGFINDWYQGKTLGTWQDTAETTVCGCVRSAINYILSQNADITVFLVLDHYGQSYGGADCSSTAENSNDITQYEYWNEIAKVAESLGIPVIPLYKISGISENTPQYLIDNIHPSTLGAKQTAYAIWEVMKGYYPNQVADE